MVINESEGGKVSLLLPPNNYRSFGIKLLAAWRLYEKDTIPKGERLEVPERVNVKV